MESTRRLSLVPFQEVTGRSSSESKLQVSFRALLSSVGWLGSVSERKAGEHTGAAVAVWDASGEGVAGLLPPARLRCSIRKRCLGGSCEELLTGWLHSSPGPLPVEDIQAAEASSQAGSQAQRTSIHSLSFLGWV